MAVSTLPAALSGLVALFAATVDVTVHDGPAVESGTDDYVCVGHDPGEGLEAASGQTPFATIGAARHEEQYDIPCVIVCTSGDLDIAACRARAFAYLDALWAALDEDYTVGNVVRVASVSSHQLLQEVDGSGATAAVRFVVSAEARI